MKEAQHTFFIARQKKMPLLIVESPAKCSKIKGFLGPSWNVIATMGHIRALQEDLDAIGLDRNFEPRYRFLTKEKKRAIDGIKEAADGLAPSQIYLASDDDREGEMISYAVCQLLKLDPASTPRAVFHEITKKAIVAAVESPRTIDMSRVLAQQARAMLDMMVGFTISPVLWKHVGRALSAGRCQSVALRLVADREAEIRAFKSATSYRLSGTFEKGGLSFAGKMLDDLEDVESVRNYLENVVGDTGATITQAAKKDWTAGAPRALMTSTLQQEASTLYGIKPKNCMSIAQKLYEEGYITYMRTDQETMSEEAVKAAQTLVDATWGKDYVGASATAAEPKKKAAAAKKKVAGDALPPQEAHEAIRPTKFDVRDVDMDAQHKKIYKLIWERAVCSVMATCRGERVVLRYRLKEDPSEFDWESEWSQTTFWGWKIVRGKEEEDTVAFKKAAAWKSGGEFNWTQLVGEPHTTKAPARYTEASLVKELEKRGIGRPSTFASLIETIQDKKYVEVSNKEARKETVERLIVEGKGAWPPREEKLTKNVGAERDKLAPTELGQRVMEFLVEHFEDLFNYEFTAKMEKRLDTIARGEEEWKGVLGETWESYKERYEELVGSKAGSGPAEKPALLERKKEFTDGLKAVFGRNGPILLREGAGEPGAPQSGRGRGRGRGGKATSKPAPQTTFYGWPEGVSWDEMDEARALAFIESTSAGIGSWNGKAIQLKTGKFGKYIECDGLRANWKEGMTVEQAREELEKKKEGAAGGKVIGKVEVRVGPYGPYMFLKDAKKKEFVSVPKGVNLDLLGEAEAEALYVKELRMKVAKGGWRGGRGGRGRSS